MAGATWFNLALGSRVVGCRVLGFRVSGFRDPPNQSVVGFRRHRAGILRVSTFGVWVQSSGRRI